ncbi:HEAT repeat domain-containing protein [Candidatus Omnitrophota bacterium]
MNKIITIIVISGLVLNSLPAPEDSLASALRPIAARNAGPNAGEDDGYLESVMGTDRYPVYEYEAMEEFLLTYWDSKHDYPTLEFKWNINMNPIIFIGFLDYLQSQDFLEPKSRDRLAMKLLLNLVVSEFMISRVDALKNLNDLILLDANTDSMIAHADYFRNVFERSGRDIIELMSFLRRIKEETRVANSTDANNIIDEFINRIIWVFNAHEDAMWPEAPALEGEQYDEFIHEGAVHIDSLVRIVSFLDRSTKHVRHKDVKRKVRFRKIIIHGLRAPLATLVRLSDPKQKIAYERRLRLLRNFKAHFSYFQESATGDFRSMTTMPDFEGTEDDPIPDGSVLLYFFHKFSTQGQYCDRKFAIFQEAVRRIDEAVNNLEAVLEEHAAEEAGTSGAGTRASSAGKDREEQDLEEDNLSDAEYISDHLYNMAMLMEKIGEISDLTLYYGDGKLYGFKFMICDTFNRKKIKLELLIDKDLPDYEIALRKLSEIRAHYEFLYRFRDESFRAMNDQCTHAGTKEDPVPTSEELPQYYFNRIFTEDGAGKKRFDRFCEVFDQLDKALDECEQLLTDAAKLSAAGAQEGLARKNYIVKGEKALKVLSQLIKEKRYQPITIPEEIVVFFERLPERVFEISQENHLIHSNKGKIHQALEDLAAKDKLGFKGIVLGSKDQPGQDDQFALGFCTYAGLGYAMDLIEYINNIDNQFKESPRMKDTHLLAEYFLHEALDVYCDHKVSRRIQEVLFPENYRHKQRYPEGILQMCIREFINSRARSTKIVIPMPVTPTIQVRIIDRNTAVTVAEVDKSILSHIVKGLDNVLVVGDRLDEYGAFRVGREDVVRFSGHKGGRIEYEIHRGKIVKTSVRLLDEGHQVIRGDSLHAEDRKTGKVLCHLPDLISKDILGALDNVIIRGDRLDNGGRVRTREGLPAFTKHSGKRIDYYIHKGQIDKTTIRILDEKTRQPLREGVRYTEDISTGEVKCHLPHDIKESFLRALDNVVIRNDSLNSKGELRLANRKRPIVTFSSQPRCRVDYQIHKGGVRRSTIRLLDKEGEPIIQGARFARDLSTGEVVCHIPLKESDDVYEGLDNALIANDSLDSQARLFVAHKFACSFNKAKYKWQSVEYEIHKGRVDRSSVRLLDSHGKALRSGPRYAEDLETKEVRCHLPELVSADLLALLDSVVIRRDKLNSSGEVFIGGELAAIYSNFPNNAVEYEVRKGKVERSSIRLLNSKGKPRRKGIRYAIDSVTGQVRCHLPDQVSKRWLTRLDKVVIMNDRLSKHGKLVMGKDPIAVFHKYKKHQIMYEVERGAVTKVFILNTKGIIVHAELLKVVRDKQGRWISSFKSKVVPLRVRRQWERIGTIEGFKVEDVNFLKLSRDYLYIFDHWGNLSNRPLKITFSLNAAGKNEPFEFIFSTYKDSHPIYIKAAQAFSISRRIAGMISFDIGNVEGIERVGSAEVAEKTDEIRKLRQKISEAIDEVSANDEEAGRLAQKILLALEEIKDTDEDTQEARIANRLNIGIKRIFQVFELLAKTNALRDYRVSFLQEFQKTQPASGKVSMAYPELYVSLEERGLIAESRNWMPSKRREPLVTTMNFKDRFKEAVLSQFNPKDHGDYKAFSLSEIIDILIHEAELLKTGYGDIRRQEIDDFMRFMIQMVINVGDEDKFPAIVKKFIECYECQQVQDPSLLRKGFGRNGANPYVALRRDFNSMLNAARDYPYFIELLDKQFPKQHRVYVGLDASQGPYQAEVFSSVASGSSLGATALYYGSKEEQAYYGNVKTLEVIEERIGQLYRPQSLQELTEAFHSEFTYAMRNAVFSRNALSLFRMIERENIIMHDKLLLIDTRGSPMRLLYIREVISHFIDKHLQKTLKIDLFMVSSDRSYIPQLSNMAPDQFLVKDGPYKEAYSEGAHTVMFKTRANPFRFRAVDEHSAREENIIVFQRGSAEDRLASLMRSLYNWNFAAEANRTKSVAGQRAKSSSAGGDDLGSGSGFEDRLIFRERMFIDLINVLRTGNPKRRTDAAEVLGQLRLREARDHLAEALSADRSRKVREAAAKALLELGLDVTELHDAIEEAMKDKESSVTIIIAFEPSQGRRCATVIQMRDYQKAIDSAA